MDDLNTVIKYLKTSENISKIILWGRSMGAVTALHFASTFNYNEIQAMILDSAF